MKRWRPLTDEEFARAEEQLRHPRPGSRIEAAHEYGVDLSLLIETLRLTPAERAARMEDVIGAAERWRGTARGMTRDRSLGG